MLWRNWKNPLTSVDYFLANEPEYLKMNPEIKARLIFAEKNNMPDECLCCIFLGHKTTEKGVEFFCSLGDITFEYGKRAKECVLDREEKSDDIRSNDKANEHH